MQRRPHSLAADTSVRSVVAEKRAPAVQKYKGKRAVVVGAGPAGLISAAYLAKHGFSVKVFEGRKDIGSSAALDARTYVIVLSGATADVLREVGVDLPSAEGGFKNGLHAFGVAFVLMNDGSVRETFTGVPNTIMGTRYSIAKTILDVIEMEYSASVALSFNHRCKNVSFKDQTIAFENLSGEEVIVEYDLLIGADGANSVVRKELKDFDKDFKVHAIQSIRSYVGLGGLTIPEGNNFGSGTLKPGWIAFSRRRGAIGKKYSPFTAYSLAADGTVHVLLGAPSKFFNFIKGREKEYIDAVLPEGAPQSWSQRIIEHLEAAAVPRSPAPIFVSKLNGPRTILIGDAAHAVSPAMGFGCNMAVTDGKGLSEALHAADGELDRVPQTFNNMRHKTVQCYQQLEAGVAEGNRLPCWLIVWRFFYLLRFSTIHVITKLFSIKRPVLLGERIMRGQISSIDAVNIVKRDCLVGTAAVVTFVVIAAKLIIIPAAKFALSKIYL